MNREVNGSERTDEIMAWLEANRNDRNIASMARFGINAAHAYGVSVPMLRKKAGEYRRRHDIALELWGTGIHEARIMASVIADPAMVTPAMMDEWVADFDSWDLCDQCCLNLFRKLPFAMDKIEAYAGDKREFVRRAAFVVIAVLAVHGRDIPDTQFVAWMELIRRYAGDERNFVRKAVNWALRQTGKRSLELNAVAVRTARMLAGSDNKTARWIGTDAVRELTSDRTLAFIRNHRPKGNLR